MRYWCQHCASTVTGKKDIKIAFDFNASKWKVSLVNKFDQTGCDHDLDGYGKTIEEAFKSLQQSIFMISEIG